MIKDLSKYNLKNVKFKQFDGRWYGEIDGSGVNSLYEIKDTVFKRPAAGVLMDLDGTTLKSEEFWIYIIERTMQDLMSDAKFSLSYEDIPYVSGFTTRDHLTYCIKKYCQDKKLNDAMDIYHRLSHEELDKILNGKGNVGAFKPTEGLKEFLLFLKGNKIKIGLATSGLDYKSIPEIVSVFKQLNLGNPLDFYDAIITGGRRKDNGEYGTLGEITSKPHPWLYTELAYSGLKIEDMHRVIGIEDSSAGVLSLRFAGFPVIGLESGNIGQSGLSDLCYKTVNRLSEIQDIIL